MKAIALIVTFNRIEKLKKCWEATSSQSFESVVIVNNASTDDTADWLSSIQDRRLIVVTSASNSGGAGGFKLGAEYIRDNLESEWVFLYDDDAYPQNKLIESFDASIDNQYYDAVCCRVIDKEGALCKMNLPWIKYPRSLADNISYIRKPETFIANGGHKQNVVSFSFVGLAIKTKVLVRTTEYIRDELFIYFDDVYYSHHLILTGHRINFNPEVYFIHDIPANIGYISPNWKVYYLLRNLLFAKFFFAKQSPFSFIFIALRIFKYTIQVIKQPKKGNYTFYYFKGIYDGLLKKFGERH
jgi:GT2 family glycosyltransferase